MRLKRNLFIHGLITAISCLILSDSSYGKMYIDITSPSFRKTPVAIAEFKDLNINKYGSSSKDIAKRLREVLINDLEFSGLFDIIEKESFIEDPERASIRREEIDFQDWRIIGSELLIKGGFSIKPATGKVGDAKNEDELIVDIRLFDVNREKTILGKRYSGSIKGLRRMMHKFANAIMEELTGEKGVFETKLAFVVPLSDNKEIFISDYDGHNIQRVIGNGSINISPQWSPDGRWLLYTSFKEGQPKLYIKNPFTGKGLKIAGYPGINIGARWSPSGKKIALTLSIHGNPEIYTMDLKTRKLTRLTHNWGIDVSPTWSPDGKRIAFVSDRAGNPHIYVIDVDGKNLKRLTYESKYNASPSWSPKRDRIAFSRYEKGHFNIWLTDPDGFQQTQLTFNAGNNEDPSWSPDGRYIVFKSDRDGHPAIYVMRADGTNQRRIADGSNPSWSP